MKTYQDLLSIGQSDQARIDFTREVIDDHKASPIYRKALVAQKYYDHKNVTIMEYQKLLYTAIGEAIPDTFSANHKMRSNFFNEFVTQENQHLLGNGVTWQHSEQTQKILGEDFDTKLQDASEAALIAGVAFGYWNHDHMEVFEVTEFAPLYDEKNAALMAGVRYWQIDESKPLRATLYEPDGYTEYIWEEGQGGRIYQPKRGYIEVSKGTEADGMKIYEFKNYEGFPIVPLWSGKAHQSRLEGLREQIDCYDLIKSGFANDVDDASLIYWIMQNAGGMDEADLARFLNRLSRTKVAMMDEDGVQIEGKSQDVPYASREAILDRLREDLYRDAQALDIKNLASGGSVVTAAIKTAYMPLNSKCDKFEFCINEFLKGIMALAGITNEKPTFTRTMLVNTTEEVTTVIQAAQFLPADYVTRKILTIMGDGDQADKILKEMDAEDMERFTGGIAPQNSQEGQNPNNNPGENGEPQKGTLPGAE